MFLSHRSLCSLVKLRVVFLNVHIKDQELQKKAIMLK